MAEEVTSEPSEPGAPIPKDQIDPELVKLSRPRPKIGLLTAAGVVFLCGYFACKLGPDRHFAGEPEEARGVTVADVAAGKVAPDSHVRVDAEPLMALTIRSSVKPGAIGMRVVPARGSSEKLWLVLPGDGWGEPNTKGYAGRVRPLDALPMAESITAYLAKNPQPVFATLDAVRAGLSTGKVATVAGDTVSVRPTDRVGYDIIEPSSASVLCTYTGVRDTLAAKAANTEAQKGEPGAANPPPTSPEPPPGQDPAADAAACAKAIADAGLTIAGQPSVGREQAAFRVTEAAASARTKLETAKLWGTTVEPITQHFETTWGELGAKLTNQVDLVGIYVTRAIPDGALVLLAGEKPADYWYVLPVTILVTLIGLLFLWALVRAIKRDFLAPA